MAVMCMRAALPLGLLAISFPAMANHEIADATACFALAGTCGEVLPSLQQTAFGAIEGTTQSPSTVEATLGLDRPTRRLIQQGLRNEGFDPGEPDGLFGPRTRAAIRRWQEARRLRPTGYLDATGAELLRSVASPPSSIRRRQAADPSPPADAEPADGASHLVTDPQPNCDGSPAGSACWMSVDNRPRCHVWTPSLTPGATVTWSGTCIDGFAQGAGSLTWTEDAAQSVHSGSLQVGKRHGHWVVGYANGDVAEGQYVNGLANGPAVFRYAEGGVAEGQYVNGQRTGTWVRRHAGGGVTEGLYLNGRPHGRWVVHARNGSTHEGPYVNGERQGTWLIRYRSGTVAEGAYTNDVRTGPWVIRHRNGGVEEGPFVNGERSGSWTLRYETTGRVRVEHGQYVKNARSGQWVVRHRSGQVDEGPYVHGERHGQWVLRLRMGRSLKFPMSRASGTAS